MIAQLPDGAPAEERERLVQSISEAVREASPENTVFFNMKCKEFVRGQITAAYFAQWLDDRLGVTFVDTVRGRGRRTRISLQPTDMLNSSHLHWP